VAGPGHVAAYTDEDVAVLGADPGHIRDLSLK